MQSEFAPVTGIDWTGEGVGMAKFGDDSKQLVFFFWKSQRNEAKSIAENKPIFEDIPYIRMHPPGERLNIIERPARDDDKYRFPRQWNQFVQKQSQVPEGTPIELLYPNHPAYADTLRAHGIYTIQQLAELSAHAIDAVGMGAQEAVNKAQRYIKESGDSKALNALRKQLEDKDAAIRVLEKQIKLQKGQIDELFARIGNTMAPTLAHLNPQDSTFDVQSARINANHPTREVKRAKVKRIDSTIDTNKITIEAVPEE